MGIYGNILVTNEGLNNDHIAPCSYEDYLESYFSTVSFLDFCAGEH